MDILLLVRETIKRYHLIKKGETVLVACSGGADSVALLYILLDLKKFLCIGDIQVAHLNHLIREDSHEDAEFVKHLCKDLYIPYVFESRDVPGYAREKVISLEEASRMIRYRFLEEQKRKLKLDLIATAHTLNDQIETLFLRIGRGTGLKGLSLIPPKRNSIIRPLIYTYKKQILEFLEKRGISYRLDRTNLDLSIKRNLIRHKVVPYVLDAMPDFGERVMRLRDNLEADSKLIDSLIEDIWREVVDIE